MQASEAVAIRERIGLTREDLAAEFGMTPDVVAAWETGRVKVSKRIARELHWRQSALDREAALTASGLAECAWMLAWEQEPSPTSLKAQTAYLERGVAHARSCPVCLQPRDAPRPAAIGVCARGHAAREGRRRCWPPAISRCADAGARARRGASARPSADGRSVPRSAVPPSRAGACAGSGAARGCDRPSRGGLPYHSARATCSRSAGSRRSGHRAHSS